MHANVWQITSVWVKVFLQRSGGAANSQGRFPRRRLLSNSSKLQIGPFSSSMVFLCPSSGLLPEQSKDLLRGRKFVLIFSRKTCTGHKGWKLSHAVCPVFLLGTQHPQLWLPTCWRTIHKVLREVQDQISSTRSSPFIFLLLYKHSLSGSPVCGGVGPQ